MATLEQDILDEMELSDGGVDMLDPYEDIREEAETKVSRMIEEGIRFFEEELEQDLIDATDYYHGRPFGDEQKGRSQVVSTDVRDVTLGQLPSLMRIFHGAEETVEFRPRTVDKIEQAKQATDMVNYVVSEENPGFLHFYAWFKDALVRRLGVVKWWWEEDQRVEATHFTGLSETQVAMLQQDPEVRVEIIDARQVGAAPLGPGGQPLGRPPLAIDAVVYRQADMGTAKFAPIPSEEFIHSPEARSVDHAPMVAHVREATKDELLNLGISEEDIDAHAGSLDRKDTRAGDGLENARSVTGFDQVEEDEENLDDSQKPVPCAEAYIRMDLDGDGFGEIRKFICLGNDWEVVNFDEQGLPGEIVDEVPFAVITPDPEPHTIIGLSNYDLVGDVQKVKSHAWRSMLDSLTLAVNPQQEVVDGEVNMKDLLNPEIGSFIRVRRPGMVREVKHQFVGGDVLPVLAAQDEMRENRTGFTKNASGLDAESLQSTTQVAAAAHVTGSKQRIELIARVFAETGVSRLYRGLLKLIVKHQNRSKMVRVRGKYVEMDPRAWDATMDVSVNVGLGEATQQERMQILSGIIALQRELQQQGSPLVSNIEISNAVNKASTLGGFKNPEMFFKPWGPQQEQAWQQEMQQRQANSPPPPEHVLLQLEQAKEAAKADLERSKLELEAWKARMEEDRERDKLARETVLREAEIEGKYATQIQTAALKAQVDRERASLDADVKREATRRRTTRPRSD